MSLRFVLLSFLVLLTQVVIAQRDLALSLVENKGQWPHSVIGATDIQGGKVFLENQRLTYHLYDLSAIAAIHDESQMFNPNDIRIKGHVYHVDFIGANPNCTVVKELKQRAHYNYFLGNDSSQWAGNCNAYARIVRNDFYPGIDFIYYSTGYTLKYDFVVKPNADASRIQLRYEGQSALALDHGRLQVKTSVGDVIEQSPIAWQIINGAKKRVECQYQLQGNTLSFSFPKGYDRSKELIIDPELIFSTYSGSMANNFGYTATYDLQGNLYSGGSTFGQGYPVTTGAYQTTFQGGHSTLGGIDMGLTKYDAGGTFLIWSTYLGGNGDDLPHSIVVNAQNELFVYGTTGSDNYPVLSGAVDVSFNGGTVASSSGTGANFPNGSDIVVTRFNSAGSQLLGSTYLGGSANDGLNLSSALKYNYADEFRGEISLANDGNPIIVSSTWSSNFPIQNAFQPSHGGAQDGVIVKLSADLSNILWSSFIGGTADDSGFSIAENETGELYICGGTSSSGFLQVNNLLQTNNAGGQSDGFVLKLSPNGQSILASTYWGSPAYDQLYFIEIDDDGWVYVFGQTTANGSQMIINASYGVPSSGNLITKFNSQLSQVIWSSVFGTGSGKPTLSPSAFLVDYCNRVYISGWGITQVAGNALNPGQHLASMASMPVTADAFDNTCTTGDFYMAVFDENMSTLEYATFFGGGQSSEHVDGGTSRFDRKGVIYQSVCAGCGGFDDFPAFPSNVWSAQNNNSCNNGVFKFDFQLPLTIADFSATPIGCTNSPITFTSNSNYAQSYSWNFGDGQTSAIQNPVHTYNQPGTYTIMLAVASNATCNGVDTLYKTIQIEVPISETLSNLALCPNESITMGPSDANDTYQYSWSPAMYLDNPQIANPQFQAGSSTQYTLTVVRDGGCVDTYYQNVDVTQLSLFVPADTTICDDEVILLEAFISPANAEIIWSDDSLFQHVLNEDLHDFDIEVSPQIPTTYYVQITANGCVLNDEVFVNLASFQTVIQGDFTACAGDTVTLSVLNPNPGFQYTWAPEPLILTGQHTPAVSVWVNEPTTIHITSESVEGCIAHDEVMIEVSPLVSSNVVVTASPAHILLGQSSQLTAQPGGYNYTWTPPNTLNNPSVFNPVATPTHTTTYWLTISDGECQVLKSVTVEVHEFVCGKPSIFVPNTFTPNADDKNEKLFVRAIELEKLYFVIYDRWGEKIFETESLNEGWDGRFRGKALPPDVYVYYLEAECKGGDTYQEQGNITLIR